MTREGIARLWPLPVLVAGAAMLAWGWLRWPDPWIDFGRELYVPWRLLAGERLYVDIAWFNGPLSPHLNALVFALFGTGLHALVALDVLLAAGIGALLLSEVARLADRLAACVAGLWFVCAFAFAQLLPVGNYNFATPYSHEITHGLGLGALAIWLCVREGGGRPTRLALAGMALGLCFLTKPEVFLAAAGGVGVAHGLASAGAPRPRREAGRRARWLLAGFAAPVGSAAALLALHMPATAALHAALGAWPHAFDSRLTSLRFYRAGTGTLDAAASLWRLLLSTAGTAALLVASAAIGLRLTGRRGRLAAAALTLLGVAWIALHAEHVAHLVRPLPAVLIALFVLAARRWRDSAGARRDANAARLAWIAWALLLLPKILLNVRLSHYGFALAMPGTLIALAAWLWALPRHVAREGGDAAGVRATALALQAAALLAVLSAVGASFGGPATQVGEGADRFAAQRRGAALARAIEAVEQHVAPDETLAVLPEGVMLNYLTRRVNPTGHVNFMPPELILFGEGPVLASFHAHPPDFVLLAHKSTAEYGLPFFGRDYGVELYRFVAERYRPVWQLGAVPLTSRRYGLQLLERSDRGDTRSTASP